MASKALSVVGRLNITYEAWRKPRNRATGDGSGSGKAAGEDGQEEKGNQMSKDEGGRNSSFSEKPVRSRPRRLVDWINLTGAKRVPFHSFFGISEVLRLRESCMRENRTCSLRGGRRPACKRASSDPTMPKDPGKRSPPRK